MKNYLNYREKCRYIMHAKFLHIIFLINYCCIIIWCMHALEYIGLYFIQYFYVYSHKYQDNIIIIKL